MENENKNVDTEQTVDTNENEKNIETVTLTQDELNKKLQSESDKVRTQYSKKVKELEAKIKELTPVEKSETELDLERRLSEIEAREAKMNFLDSLKENDISSEFADYLKSDSDLSKFAEVYKQAVSDAVTKKIKESGFTPKSHKSGETLTKEEFRKMTYEEKSQLFVENPELYKSLSGR